MSVAVRVLNKDYNRDVLECAYATIGKEYEGQVITEKGMKNWILREHSPIEVVHIKVDLRDIPKPVIAQIVRHTKQLPRYFVRTSRPDRTGKERDPKALCSLSFVANPLALVNMFRQRLCSDTEKDTQAVMREVKDAMMQSEDLLLRTVGWAMIPDCYYRFSCNQSSKCGAVFTCPASTSMHTRIDEYNNLIKRGCL